MQATELRVLAGGGIAVPLKEIAAQFETASDHKVTIHFGTTPELIKLATSGVSFDLVVVPQDVMQDAGARAQFAPEPTPNVARVGFGIAVRCGARKPGINTSAALKQTLLAAQSIASIPASAAGTQLAAIYAQLGILDEMTAKIRAQPTPAHIIDAVANGQAELGVFLLNVLTDPRLDVVGPFPTEVQREVVYQAGVATSTTVPDAAKAFIDYLLSPAAATVIRTNGMTPG